VGKDIFRRKCLLSLRFDPKNSMSNYELAQLVTAKGKAFGEMPAATVYNWLEGRSKVPGAAALLISIHAG
jgi:DNA-binding transcriptional regulator YiaG